MKDYLVSLLIILPNMEYFKIYECYLLVRLHLGSEKVIGSCKALKSLLFLELVIFSIRLSKDVILSSKDVILCNLLLIKSV